MRLRYILASAVVSAGLAPASAGAYFPHVVSPGETLTSVAAADGLSIADVAAANGLSPDTELIAGSTLLIPPQMGGPVVSSSGSSGESSGASEEASDVSSDSGSTATGGSYLVQPGDTLSAIAARDGTTVDALASANGLDPNGLLLWGTTLTLPGASSSSSPVSSSSEASSSSESSSGQVEQVGADAPPFPTPERVTSSEVGSIAEANGVSPSLAAAIGYQESGFNNALVSSADARGVMQILPTTWAWINQDLTNGVPLAPASAADNVRGGVLLLRSLLSDTGGDPGLAAAGYYQGLSSVQQTGEDPSTQQYVANVLALRQQFGGP